MTISLEEVTRRIKIADRIWLFLDYDGTLSDFAPNPDIIEPKPGVVKCIRRLSEKPDVRVSVISGRRLEHVRKLVPVSGILLAGTYGIEILAPDGKLFHREDLQKIRPVIDWLKPRWEALLDSKNGFYLEDKGWSLAIHAKDAEHQQASQLLATAKNYLEMIEPKSLFRILGGDKFLEIGPAKAHKGKSVRFLMDEYPFAGALPIYVGDDDKDEEAFEVVMKAGGFAVQVSRHTLHPMAAARLEDPRAVLKWLNSLI
jgi:trehalose 6-phosphate phosphatase